MLIGSATGAALIWAALFASDAALDHRFDRMFLAAYECRLTGLSFEDCTRGDPGSALHALAPPQALATGPWPWRVAAP